MKQRTYSVEMIAGLLLFCLFTITMLFVLISGAKAYKGINSSMKEQYQERTALSYLAAKIRHFDNRGNVYLSDFDGTTALTLDENINGDNYTTMVYYYDGYVYELFTVKDSGLTPADGLEIIEADSIVFEEVSRGLFKLECSVAGRSSEIYVGTRSEKGGDMQ